MLANEAWGKRPKGKQFQHLQMAQIALYPRVCTQDILQLANCTGAWRLRTDRTVDRMTAGYLLETLGQINHARSHLAVRTGKLCS